ncbi:hypothetical protein THAOC_25680 [Thalassiosira oceanica]|uniref:UDP-N-acetylglucosamine transferase subunit ALG14 n=1 Tax=Thalassiosira oceanica TaxID=159749 RepID=K0S767_THAOC|nr:hypothetical protein THAOC_25680 [Thalassiosira oceanica]|eukprot:EJK54672.1 hypothetical protein THAOC_25680 [Thalassiosira oceanica]
MKTAVGRYLLPIEVGANSGAAKCDPTVFDIDTSRPAGLFGLTAHLYIYTTARGGMGDALLVVVVSTAASAVLVRIVSLIMSIRKCRASRRGDEKCVQPVKTALKTMVVLGSGGHTTEMIRLVEQLDPTRYSPLVYVVAEIADLYIVFDMEDKAAIASREWPRDVRAGCLFRFHLQSLGTWHLQSSFRGVAVPGTDAVTDGKASLPHSGRIRCTMA